MLANKYTGISKRGNRYNIRNNKTANGFSKMTKDNNYSYGNIATATQKQKDILRLSVLGTLDTIVCSWGITRFIQKEHHTDKGYFKKVVVLNQFGKTRLRKARLRKAKKQTITT